MKCKSKIALYTVCILSVSVSSLALATESRETEPGIVAAISRSVISGSHGVVIAGIAATVDAAVIAVICQKPWDESRISASLLTGGSYLYWARPKMVSWLSGECADSSPDWSMWIAHTLVYPAALIHGLVR